MQPATTSTFQSSNSRNAAPSAPRPRTLIRPCPQFPFRCPLHLQPPPDPGVWLTRRPSSLGVPSSPPATPGAPPVATVLRRRTHDRRHRGPSEPLAPSQGCGSDERSTIRSGCGVDGRKTCDKITVKGGGRSTGQFSSISIRRRMQDGLTCV
jgi:hypothetical protein